MRHFLLLLFYIVSAFSQSYNVNMLNSIQDKNNIIQKFSFAVLGNHGIGLFEDDSNYNAYFGKTYFSKVKKIK